MVWYQDWTPTHEVLDLGHVHLELVALADGLVLVCDRHLKGVHVAEDQVGQPQHVHHRDAPLLRLHVLHPLWAEDNILFTFLFNKQHKPHHCAPHSEMGNSYDVSSLLQTVIFFTTVGNGTKALQLENMCVEMALFIYLCLKENASDIYIYLNRLKKVFKDKAWHWKKSSKTVISWWTFICHQEWGLISNCKGKQKLLLIR